MEQGAALVGLVCANRGANTGEMLQHPTQTRINQDCWQPFGYTVAVRGTEGGQSIQENFKNHDSDDGLGDPVRVSLGNRLAYDLIKILK